MIHVWDNYEGLKRIDAALRRCEELLRAYSVELANHRVINSHLTGLDTIQEGELFHGVATFRIVTEEK
jgi:hypothetical protein